MKKIIVLSLASFIVLSCLAQENLPRTYDYDAAGNRILRSTIEVDAKSLQFGQPVASSYYRLSNLAGQLLSEAWITGTTITIDLSAYKTGVYMLTIALNGKTETWKILKK